jgi:hypothetical protein
MSRASKRHEDIKLDASEATSEASVTLPRLKSVIDASDTECAEESEMLVITNGILNGVEIKIYEERRAILFFANIPIRENLLSNADGVAQLHALLNELNTQTLLVSYCARNDLLTASYCLFYDGYLIHAQLLRALYWFSRYVIHDLERCDRQGLVNLA